MIFTKAFSKFLNSKWNQLLLEQSRPKTTQEKAFQRLKKSLGETEIGRKYGLDRIQSLQEFVRKVPVTHYEDYTGEISQIEKGEARGTLFNDRLQFVGLTSGTTGRNSKSVLYNDAMLKNLEKFQLQFASILERHTKVRVMRDKRLTWGSSARISQTPEGIPCGYISGYLSSRSPWIINRHAFPRRETALLLDMKDKIERTADEISNQDLRLLSGVPTYLISLLEELKQKWNIPNFSKVWPNLDTIVYSATSIEPYKAQLTELIGRPLKFIGCYASTEGPIGFEIPRYTNENGVYAFYLGDFVYAFRKLGEDGARSDTGLMTIAELKPGDEVEILISSPNGFLNYAMGDCLRILSTYPLISFEILGRVGNGLNVAAEKVPLVDLQKSVVRVGLEMQTPIRHFFVHPGQSAEGRPCYEWTFLVDDPDQWSEEKTAAAIDHALMTINGDYEENRIETFFLDVPRVHFLSADVGRRYFEQESHRGQLKMKSVFDSGEKFRDFLGRLIGFAEPEKEGRYSVA